MGERMQGYLVRYVVDVARGPCEESTPWFIARVVGWDAYSGVGLSREAAIDALRLVARDCLIVREELGYDLPRAVKIKPVAKWNDDQPEPEDRIFIRA